MHCHDSTPGYVELKANIEGVDPTENCGITRSLHLTLFLVVAIPKPWAYRMPSSAWAAFWDAWHEGNVFLFPAHNLLSRAFR